MNISSFKCMIATTGAAVPVDDVSAAVLFTRYMDNTYLRFCNVPEFLLLAVRHFVEIFQHVLYEVPFKWEPQSQFLHWGECSVMCTDTLSLTIKGMQRVESFFNPEMWNRWRDRWSPNCPLGLQSMIPALVHKVLQLCNSTQCRGHNIRGLVPGFGYKHYIWEWLYMPLTCRLQALYLESLCDHRSLKAWALKGASFAASLRRGGGCTHTQESSQYLCLLSAMSFSESLWVWVTEYLRYLSVPDSDYVFLTLWSFCACLWHCVLHCAHCTHALCTMHARTMHTARMHYANSTHAACTLHTRTMHTARTHRAHCTHALCKLHTHTVHTARTHCARCTHALYTLHACIVQTASMHSANCTHALCTLHARIVHTARAHCARCRHAPCTLHTCIVQTARTHCGHCRHALCTLHARIVHAARTHLANCTHALWTLHARTVYAARTHCAPCTTHCARCTQALYKMHTHTHTQESS